MKHVTSNVENPGNFHFYRELPFLPPIVYGKQELYFVFKL